MDQGTVSAKAEMPLRAILVGTLLSIIAFGTVDLMMDRPATWWTVHVVFEMSMIVGALLIATTMWAGWRRSVKSAVVLHDRLVQKEMERDRWRATSQHALDGLARAINDQFNEWHLTPAEREVALMLLKGYGHKQIAALTGRSERAARQHAGAVYEKSSLAGRSELAAYFLQDLMIPEADREVLRME